MSATRPTSVGRACFWGIVPRARAQWAAHWDWWYRADRRRSRRSAGKVRNNMNKKQGLAVLGALSLLAAAPALPGDYS